MHDKPYSQLFNLRENSGKIHNRCTTTTVKICDYTVFLRVLWESYIFYSVLPYKMSVSHNCIFTRVLPRKSQKRVPKWHQNGPQNGPGIVQYACFPVCFVVHMCKTPVFYRVKWYKIVKNRHVENNFPICFLRWRLYRVLPAKMRVQKIRQPP